DRAEPGRIQPEALYLRSPGEAAETARRPRLRRLSRALPAADPRLQGRVARLSRRILFPLPRTQPALRRFPTGTRDRYGGPERRGVPDLHRLLAGASATHRPPADGLRPARQQERGRGLSVPGPTGRRHPDRGALRALPAPRDCEAGRRP